MYDRTSIGWAAVVWYVVSPTSYPLRFVAEYTLIPRFCVAACAVGVPLTGMMAGKRPLFRRIMDIRRQQSVKEDLE